MAFHDTWDNFPEYGIRDSWRSFLGFEEMITKRPYVNLNSEITAKRNSLPRTIQQSVEKLKEGGAPPTCKDPSYSKNGGERDSTIRPKPKSIFLLIFAKFLLTFDLFNCIIQYQSLLLAVFL
jgi:hypothetical protein